MGYGSFKPLLMAIFSKGRYDTKTLCELLSLMERFIFLMFEVCNLRSNLKDSEFYGYANKYYYDEISLEDIMGIDDKNLDKCSGLYKYLIHYIHNDFHKFIEQIQENFSKDDKYGYYSWKGLKYFLYEYELHLKENEYKENEYKIKSWDDYIRSKKDHETIEHVLPQNPKTKVLETKDKNLIKYFTHTLGNLVPLSKEKNSSLSNDNFNEKKNRFKSGSYSEIEIYDNLQWGENEIEKRTEKLIDFLFSRWEIKDYYFNKNDTLEQIKKDLREAGKPKPDYFTL
ncbi:HNH endonuclease [Campylobacter jejuni]|nr:HNH endonuclease [Campylobacter jejuni]